MKPSSRTHIYLLAFFLHGCATYNPSDYYDPNAKVKLGRITQKILANYEMRPAADNPMIVPVPGLISHGTALILQKAMSNNSQIPIYAHTISTEGGVDIVVLSEFPSHNIGDCVKVFISDRQGYPRMTPWAECK